ncbi:hypothetical protein QA584_22600 [Anaerocolumna sp. AGMB13025]|uniref:hypothetical protein n=1 Tax=Anaerocolumna sp. AGMB13025 TaxID=3039116 RepID=UPI00241D870C|nr:hypothetical protein [Anaerocolumna sp. AGMB13025]WFR56376.1 hypothetical protein QA584_22600 [Anaerocolumna sp. AGMB13025]
MKKYVELYDNTKTYIFPNMAVATPDIVGMNYAVVNTGQPVVIETDESRIMLYSIDLLSATKSRLGIELDLSIEDTLATIEDILNAPVPEPEPTAEERIAAALEFQNLLSM